MTLKLVQVRECDGKCCEESPRFPNRDHSDCVFHDMSKGKETAGCILMTGEKTITNEVVINYQNRDAQSVFEETCVKWPQQNSVPDIGDTGGCCWQWVEG